jgi:hypothetical protein
MITILKFQEIHAALNIEPENDIRTSYNVMSVLTGKSVDEYRQMAWLDFLKEQESITFPTIGDMPDEWVKEFEVDGEKFYVNQFVTDWNTEQFINMQTFTKDQDDIVFNLHSILATLCYKEKGEDINLTEFNRRSKLFHENLDIRTAYPIGFFFAMILSQLSKTMVFSLMMKKLKIKLKWKQLKRKIGFMINGVGTTQ